MKVAVLGATGSIGRSSLNLAALWPDKIKIQALAGWSRVEELAAALERFRPPLAAVAGEAERKALRLRLKERCPGYRPEILTGPEGQIEAAVSSGSELVLSAIVGEAGLRPAWESLRRGLKLALANKEALVMAGELIMPLAAETGAKLTPVDSEHSAIFQILGTLKAPSSVRRLILTASGGPFRGFTAAQLSQVSLAEALRHPRWSMGPKISCDSATLMNKGLELIEAHHLFNMPYEKLEVLVHPQSIVHSIVEYEDGAQLFQCGPTDMRQAIAYALSHPERWPLLGEGSRTGLENYEALDLAQLSRSAQGGGLSFEKPDELSFPALALARAAGRQGGTAPSVLNGANEEAVRLFLAGAIGFTRISQLVEMVLETLPGEKLSSVEQAQAASAQARRLVRESVLGA